MARIHIEREHGLGLEEARRQIDQVAETLRDQLQARLHWQGDRLEFERPGAHGIIEVAQNRVTQGGEQPQRLAVDPHHPRLE